MSMLDMFRADAFSLTTLTDKINKIPFVPGRLGAMGLFEESGINTLTAQIEEKGGVLYLVPTAPRGGPAAQNLKEGRKVHPLNVVHLPVEDRLMADEIQGIRAFGTESELETIQGKVAEKQATMVQGLEATFEHMRVGAVKGRVMDADGTTVLYDLFDEFGVTEDAPVNFDFGSTPPLGSIRTAIHQIQRRQEDLLGATPSRGVGALVGSEFMDMLVAEPETRVAYERWREGEMLRDTFARRTFGYAGILFEEYRGKVGSVDFIADSEARFFPLGVPGLFRAVFGPANFIDTVNTVGIPIYSKIVPDPAERWVDVYAQSNPLFYCTRPSVLRQGLAHS